MNIWTVIPILILLCIIAYLRNRMLDNSLETYFKRNAIAKEPHPLNMKLVCWGVVVILISLAVIEGFGLFFNLILTTSIK